MFYLNDLSGTCPSMKSIKSKFNFEVRLIFMSATSICLLCASIKCLSSSLVGYNIREMTIRQTIMKRKQEKNYDFLYVEL